MRAPTEIGSHLEALVTELVRRRWAARAALVSDQGEVLALCAAPHAQASASALEPRAAARGASAVSSPAPLVDEEGEAQPAAAERTARLLIESLDEQRWLYLDFGSTRLVARLNRASYAGAATSFLIGELRRIGVTVERETLAQD